ncbi:MAG TPA: hypothetical protein VF597_02110 [Candidatus Saccharimonadales bacterium]|jgi:23S rRNA (uracil1939-C5)-methyltransferase
MIKPQLELSVRLDKIVGGGQSLGTMDDGRKAFVWGGLPGETVTFSVSKKKSKFVEGIVTSVTDASDQRVAPRDEASYLSTSPWQMMSFDAEQHYKAALLEEAFELHDIVLPSPIDIYTDEIEYGYRNKIEFSWWGDTDDDGKETLDLAFFRRGSKGKIPVDGMSLARPEINRLAIEIRDHLRSVSVSARRLKTLLIRCDQAGNCVWQLYVKDQAIAAALSPAKAKAFPAQGGEIIFSEPKSPASRITKRLTAYSDVSLQDTVLGTPFRYAAESFFQVNVPVYERALTDMAMWLPSSSAGLGQTASDENFALPAKRGKTDDQMAPSEFSTKDGLAEAGHRSTPPRVLDLYSGVGTIGLTIGGPGVTLVESDENAVREMRRNILEQDIDAVPIHAPSEKAVEYITGDKLVIVDPPRAGLHADVIAQLLEVKPARIVYLSCNPVTQARDVGLLAEAYGIRHHQGYNFFPRTPHIEHLVVLDLKAN